jgi:hypothetical protein
LTQEEKIKQQAQYARQLLDAVYEPERIKRQRITERRRINKKLKEQEQIRDAR